MGSMNIDDWTKAYNETADPDGPVILGSKTQAKSRVVVMSAKKLGRSILFAKYNVFRLHVLGWQWNALLRTHIGPRGHT